MWTRSASQPCAACAICVTQPQPLALGVGAAQACKEIGLFTGPLKWVILYVKHRCMRTGSRTAPSPPLLPSASCPAMAPKCAADAPGGVCGHAWPPSPGGCPPACSGGVVPAPGRRGDPGAESLLTRSLNSTEPLEAEWPSSKLCCLEDSPRAGRAGESPRASVASTRSFAASLLARLVLLERLLPAPGELRPCTAGALADGSAAGLVASAAAPAP